MTDDHEMRASCGIEFGKINKELEFHKEWRQELRDSLHKVQKEVEKLTGNGNRGRIDEISSDLADIKTMLVSHLAEAAGRDNRITMLEGQFNKLDNRVYSIAIKVAAAAAALALFVNYLIDAISKVG